MQPVLLPLLQQVSRRIVPFIAFVGARRTTFTTQSSLSAFALASHQMLHKFDAHCTSTIRNSVNSLPISSIPSLQHTSPDGIHPRCRI
jgi:hypothetical protein